MAHYRSVVLIPPHSGRKPLFFQEIFHSVCSCRTIANPPYARDLENKMRIMLTDIAIQKLRFDTQTKVMDTAVPGFGILVGKRAKTFFVVKGKKLMPDSVFMLSDGEKDLLVFLEIDRGTEATYATELTRKSWRRTISQYKEVIAGGMYKKHFGVTCGALLMIVTISKAKENGILKDIVAKEFPNGCSYILTTHIPEFGRIFHPPRMLDMLGTTWNRWGQPAFCLLPK